MRIGIFDSGLGGLVIANAIRNHLPQYDYVYFGDTLNVPYGGRSKQAVYQHTERAMDYLMRQENCALVIIACNTATAHCGRLLQQFFLVRAFPERRILGVVIPTLETCVDAGYKRIGMLATAGMIESMLYEEELKKLDPDISFFGKASPLLVPMIENDGQEWIEPVLDEYLAPLTKENIECLILGCTHYPLLKNQIQKRVGDGVKLISQDEIIPHKLTDYLKRNTSIETTLSKNGTMKYIVSDMTDSYKKAAYNIVKSEITLEKPLRW
ncbi:MAG: glutamate racemase [Alphaproteobacteria bacterium]|nr:MAG: glutamate racemase [Alphaproteobacteria bacterium]